MLALAAVAAACGGDGELTLEEYFQKVQAADDEFQRRGEELDEEFGVDGTQFESEEEELDAIRDFFSQSVPTVRDFLSTLGDIDPPAEVEDAHREAVDAGGAALRLFEDFVDQLADVESASELEALFENPELEAAGERFDEACFTLEGIADANGIAVNLNCEDEE